MKKIILFIGLFIFCSAKLIFADPPEWAPAHGYYKKDKHHHHEHHEHHEHDDHDEHWGYKTKKKEVVVVHHYYYYPKEKVYYNKQQNKYFWLDAGIWKMGVKLPTSISLGKNSPVKLDLDTDKPYERQSQVEIKFK